MMKLSELIKKLQELEEEHGADIEIDVGMSDCMSTLIISKIINDDAIVVIIEPIKLIHFD